MAQALVPLKDLVAAKTRLSGLLRPSERRALAQAMAEDVLKVLGEHPDISAVTLVSDDPCAAMLAAQYGARHWPERALGCEGLNAVITTASQRLLNASDEPLLVLHADLPLLAREDVSAVLRMQAESGGLIIGCDQRRTGTNLLAFDAGCVPVFAFGAGSCQAHEQWALSNKLPVHITARSGIAVDVDEPEDLHVLMTALAALPGRRTGGLLCDTELGARLLVTLEALEGWAQAAANAELNPADSEQEWEVRN